ncbi:hypothetical protein [Pectinatus cerevisiiphilus]|nr:hypothetical protein [Pectinatus cerevisiiphilus]
MKKDIEIYTFSDMQDQDEMKYGLNGSPTNVQRIFPPVSDKVQEYLEGTSEELAAKIYGTLKQKKFIVG